MKAKELIKILLKYPENDVLIRIKDNAFEVGDIRHFAFQGIREEKFYLVRGFNSKFKDYPQGYTGVEEL